MWRKCVLWKQNVFPFNLFFGTFSPLTFEMNHFAAKIDKTLGQVKTFSNWWLSASHNTCLGLIHLQTKYPQIAFAYIFATKVHILWQNGTTPSGADLKISDAGDKSFEAASHLLRQVLLTNFEASLILIPGSGFLADISKSEAGLFGLGIWYHV